MGISRTFKNAFKIGRLILGGQTAGFITISTKNGVPVDGTSGTLAALAQPGSLVLDTVSMQIYQNVNTLASPKWAAFSHLRTFRALLSFAVDGGAVSTITPATTAVLPANAIITSVIVNSTTAVTSAGSATVSIGTSAGSSTTALLGATAKASLGANVLVAGVPIPNDATKWVKLTAAGSITFSVATAALTAGIIEVHGNYFIASA